MRKLSFFVLISFIFIGFMSAQTISVTSPHAGDTWYKGSTHNITWTSSGNAGVNVKINFFKDQIDQAHYIPGSQIKCQNTGSKSWTIPLTYATGTYYIRIKGVDSNWNDVGVHGDSGPFTITDPPTPTATLTVTNPPHFSPVLIIWNPGSTVQIKWTTTGDFSALGKSNVKINIFKDSIHQENFVHQLTQSTGCHVKDWPIPADYLGKYYIRIKTEDGTVHGDGGPVTIKPIAKFHGLVNTTINKSHLELQDLPDFIVYGEQLGFIDWNNKVVKYHVAVKNKGSKDAVNIPVKLDIYLRGNPGYIVNTLTYTIPSLPKNMTATWDKTYQLTKIGTYDFTSKVNPNATIKEYRYNNNTGVRKTISREALPDLIVWLMTVRVTMIGKERVWVGVKNIGQKVSSPTKLKFYIQTKGTKYLDIPQIEPGKFYTAERKEWFHSLRDVWVEMTIDPYYKLREDKENNNYAKTKLIVWSNTIFDK